MRLPQFRVMALGSRLAVIGAAIAMPLILAFSIVAAAAVPVYTGEQFNFVATQTSGGGGGGTGTGTITIGTPTTGDFYTVSDGSFISALKGCLTCDLLSQDLSHLFFDSATLGVAGTVTGTYLNELGYLHDFNLIVTDAPTLTWDFTKHNQVFDTTKESNGTYYLVESPPPGAVPLPAALPLFASGLGVIGLLARHRKSKNAAGIATA